MFGLNLKTLCVVLYMTWCVIDSVNAKKPLKEEDCEGMWNKLETKEKQSNLLRQCWGLLIEWKAEAWAFVFTKRFLNK